MIAMISSYVIGLVLGPSWLPVVSVQNFLQRFFLIPNVHILRSVHGSGIGEWSDA